MKAASRSVIRRASNQKEARSLGEPVHDGSGSTALESCSSTSYMDSTISPISPEGSEMRTSVVSNENRKPRKSKMQKIQELLDENRQLKNSTWQMKQELAAKELQLKALSAQESQFASGEGTKEEHTQGKHMEALRALSAVTKTQQVFLAGHHERYEELSREFEESQHQMRQLKKDLSKKKKEVAMLEKEIDSNLLEITGLRKELAQALQSSENLETAKTQKSGASDDKGIKEKQSIIASQQVDLEKQKERIQQLQAELELTQVRVKRYEKERDATVAEMETCYEAMKREIEEKDKLLEAAETEKRKVEAETAKALRALEQRCDQLNVELLDAQDEMSVLRRENDASSLASLKSDAMQLDFEEERERLKSTLASMEAELNVVKNRHKDMQLEHASANQALQEENENLKIQYEEFRSMLREADIRNQVLSEENEIQKVQNETLLDVSRDLKVKLREAELSKEGRAGDAAVSETDREKEQVTGVSHDQSRVPNSTLLASGSSIVATEDWQGSIDMDLDNVNGESNSSFLSDEAVFDSQGSRASSPGAPFGQEPFPPASKNSPCSSDQDDQSTGQVGPAATGQVGPAATGQVGPAATGQVGPTATGQAGPVAGGQADQQALLLAAAADRKMQQSQSEKPNTSWRLRKRSQTRPNSPLPPMSGTSTSISSASGADKQIESLERENQEQKKLIKKLRSEIVRLNAFYRDAAYINKKKVETLVQENAAYEIKVIVLEKTLEKLGGAIESHSQSVDVTGNENVSQAKDPLHEENSTQSGGSSKEEKTPQRDWSSPPKFLDRIKELEGQVKSLEREKRDAEAKIKVVESDLEHYQQTSKKAALDSVFEIERLKRENADKERRLVELRAERPDEVAETGTDANMSIMASTYTDDMDREAVGESED